MSWSLVGEDVVSTLGRDGLCLGLRCSNSRDDLSYSLRGVVAVPTLCVRRRESPFCQRSGLIINGRMLVVLQESRAQHHKIWHPRPHPTLPLTFYHYTSLTLQSRHLGHLRSQQPDITLMILTPHCISPM